MGASVLVSIDGPSKSGSTFFAGYVEGETEYQQYPARVKIGWIDELRGADAEHSDDLETLRGALFQHVGRISAGNYFRALALAYALGDLAGQPVKEFRPSSPEDRSVLADFMAIKGIERVLQTDPNVGANVSTVAQMPGAIDLCESAFCDAVSSAYHRDGGNNLVIADGRNPLEIYERRGLLGEGTRQVAPQSIVPVYLFAPAEVAATWLGGDHAAKVKEILARRSKDEERSLYPFREPGNLTADIGAWTQQFYPPGNELVPQTFRLENGEGVSEGNIQWAAGLTAVIAWDLHGMLNKEAAQLMA